MAGQHELFLLFNSWPVIKSYFHGICQTTSSPSRQRTNILDGFNAYFPDYLITFGRIILLDRKTVFLAKTPQISQILIAEQI
jgi:hypothetical protein